MTSVIKNNCSIDIAKFVAAVFVVFLHTRPFIGTPLDYFLNVFFVMAVPYFFCISSFLFYCKEGSINKYIKRISTLYVVWFLIEIPYVYNKFILGKPILEGLKDFAWSLVFSNTFLASWYLMASLIAMTVVYFFHKRGKTRLLYTVGAISFALSLFGSMYNGLLKHIGWGGANS